LGETTPATAHANHPASVFSCGSAAELVWHLVGSGVDEWPSDGVFSEVLLGYLGAIGRGETDEAKPPIASRL